MSVPLQVISARLQKKKKKKNFFSGGRQGGFQGWVVVGRVEWWLLPPTAAHCSYIPAMRPCTVVMMTQFAPSWNMVVKMVCEQNIL